MSNADNLFQQIPEQLPAELFETLLESQNVRVERIVSCGHSSPPDVWYDQDRAEWVLVLQGRATLTFADGTPPCEMTPGDFINIPAHQQHRVEWTTPDGPTIWLAIHYE